MKLSSDHVMGTIENERRCLAMRYDVKDMHLVNRNAGREAPFCGADASDNERMGVDYYLGDAEGRLQGREHLPGVQVTGDAARRGGHRGRSRGT